jgi:hypothetical protein
MALLQLSSEYGPPKGVGFQPLVGRTQRIACSMIPGAIPYK